MFKFMLSAPLMLRTMKNAISSYADGITSAAPSPAIPVARSAS